MHVAPHLRALLAATIAIAATPANAATVRPHDMQGVIEGRAGEQIPATITLISTDADVKDLSFFTRDFPATSGKDKIAAGAIKITSDGALMKLVPKSFPITFDVKRPGLYTGTIDVYAGAMRVLQIPLSIRARPVPALTATAYTLRFVHGDGRIGKCLAAYLLPPSSDPNGSRIVTLQNPKRAEVVIRHLSLTAAGSNGRTLPASAVQLLPQPPTAPTHDPTIDITVKVPGVSKLPPDRYNGTLFVDADDVETANATAVEIDVRTTPVLPLVLLMVGIVAGWVVHFFETTGTQQLQLLNRAARVTWDLSTDDIAIIAPMIEEARDMVKRMEFDTATATLNTIEARANTLRRLDRLSTELRGMRGDPARLDPIFESIEAIRAKVRAGDDDTVADVQQVVREIENLGASEPTVATARVVALAYALPHWEQGHWAAARPRRSFAEWFAHLRMLLLPFTRWIVYIALLAGLTWVGFYTLYVQNATFGSNGFADYVGLVLWALSTDVASKTLSGLRNLAVVR
jgi:uncharacterized protein YdbL (DUF1318 family)